MDIVISPVAQSHAVSFRDALDCVARERKYLALTEAPPMERVLAFVRDNIANNHAQFVALEGERVVGWADIVPGWAHGVAHRGALGMGVLAEHRGRGIGRRLLDATLQKSWARGLTRIELEVRSDNTAAIRLYESFGFVTEATKVRGVRIDGVYHDSLQMRLLQG